MDPHPFAYTVTPALMHEAGEVSVHMLLSSPTSNKIPFDVGPKSFNCVSVLLSYGIFVEAGMVDGEVCIAMITLKK